MALNPMKSREARQAMIIGIVGSAIAFAIVEPLLSAGGRFILWLSSNISEGWSTWLYMQAAEGRQDQASQLVFTMLVVFPDHGLLAADLFHVAVKRPTKAVSIDGIVHRRRVRRSKCVHGRRGAEVRTQAPQALPRVTGSRACWRNRNISRCSADRGDLQNEHVV